MKFARKDGINFICTNAFTGMLCRSTTSKGTVLARGTKNTVFVSEKIFADICFKLFAALLQNVHFLV